MQRTVARIETTKKLHPQCFDIGWTGAGVGNLGSRDYELMNPNSRSQIFKINLNPRSQILKINPESQTQIPDNPKIPGIRRSRY